MIGRRTARRSTGPRPSPPRGETRQSRDRSRSRKELRHASPGCRHSVPRRRHARLHAGAHGRPGTVGRRLLRAGVGDSLSTTGNRGRGANSCRPDQRPDDRAHEGTCVDASAARSRRAPGTLAGRDRPTSPSSRSRRRATRSNGWVAVMGELKWKGTRSRSGAPPTPSAQAVAPTDGRSRATSCTSSRSGPTCAPSEPTGRGIGHIRALTEPRRSKRSRSFRVPGMPSSISRPSTLPGLHRADAGGAIGPERREQAQVAGRRVPPKEDLRNSRRLGGELRPVNHDGIVARRQPDRPVGP